MSLSWVGNNDEMTRYKKVGVREIYPLAKLKLNPNGYTSLEGTLLMLTELNIVVGEVKKNQQI